jgi:hypothetical protein
MKGRCYNENNKKFEIYGARGIYVCDEWKNDFLSFYKWSMENGYTNETTLDRIDCDKGYCKENCRWTTAHVQAANRRKQKNNTTGYVGVYYEPNNKRKYRAGIRKDRKYITIGFYFTPEEAVFARNKYIKDNSLFEYMIQPL